MVGAVVGTGFTVTAVVADAMQPGPEPLTVTVYVPAMAAVIPLLLGVAVVAVKPDGPLQE